MIFDIITISHHFMLEFVDSGLYFVQDENNFIIPLLQVGSGYDEKVPDQAGQKSTNPTGSGSSSLLKINIYPLLTICR